MATERKPTLSSKPTTISPGVTGTPVDLTQMAEEELAKGPQPPPAPTLGPNPPAPENFVHSDQHLEDAPVPVPVEEPPPKGADRAYATEEDALNVLKMLKAKIGVQRVPPVDVNVDELRFTLVKLSDRDVEWSLGNSDENTSHRTASLTSLRTSIVAISTRAINGVPLYKVVNVEIPKDSRDIEQVIEEPLYPPVAIRFAAASKLLGMLRDEMDDTVCPALYEIYNTQIEEKHSVKVELTAPFSEAPSEKEETQS